MAVYDDNVWRTYGLKLPMASRLIREFVAIKRSGVESASAEDRVNAVSRRVDRLSRRDNGGSARALTNNLPGGSSWTMSSSASAAGDYCTGVALNGVWPGFRGRTRRLQMTPRCASMTRLGDRGGAIASANDTQPGMPAQASAAGYALALRCGSKGSAKHHPITPHGLLQILRPKRRRRHSFMVTSWRLLLIGTATIRRRTPQRAAR